MQRVKHAAPAVLIVLTGIFCLIFHKHIFRLLPTILGVMMVLRGITMLIEGIRDGDYRKKRSNGIGLSMIYLVIGTGVLIKQDEAIFVVGIFWGVYGLLKAANQIGSLLYVISTGRKAEKWKTILVIEILIGFVMSTLLIFDPDANTIHHILLLGCELIYEGLVDLFTKYVLGRRSIRQRVAG